MSTKTSSDLQGDHKTQYAKWSAAPVAAALINFDSAVGGPGIIQPPENRIMTGCVTVAQGAEQRTATAGRDFTKPVDERGKLLGSP